MAMSLARPLLAAGVLILFVGTGLAASQSQQPFYWWRSEVFKKELSLTTDQVARIDKVHQSTLPELRQEWGELERLESKLAKTIETSEDEALLARQIDRVETARASLNKTRQLMLARMRLILTPDQRVKLSALVDREAGRRGDQRRSMPPAGKQNR